MSKTPEEYKALVDGLNLEPIMAKLESEGMDKETIEQLEEMYRGFLLLYALNPGMIIVPTRELDEFWHTHILDTLKYQEDCETVFGFFLHHFPYFGMRDEDDAADLQQKFEQTTALYEATFGRPYRLSSQMDTVCNGGVCGYMDSWRPAYTYAG